MKKKSQWTPERRAQQAEIARGIAEKRDQKKWKKSLSDAQTRLWEDPEYRKEAEINLAAARENIDWEKQAIASTEANQTPEKREAISQWALFEWSKPEPFGGKRYRVSDEEKQDRKEEFKKKAEEYNELKRLETERKIEEHKERARSSGRKSKITTASWAFRDGMRRRNLRQWTPERRAKQAEYAREMVRKRQNDPESKREHDEQLSIALSSRWAKPEAHEQQSEYNRQMHEAGIIQWSRPSKPQLELLAMIEATGVTGFRCEVKCGRYSLDIANEERKLCVEVDGEFWHALNLTNYEKRDAFIRSKGWNIVRFGTTEVELKKALAWIVDQTCEVTNNGQET